MSEENKRIKELEEEVKELRVLKAAAMHIMTYPQTNKLLTVMGNWKSRTEEEKR